MLRLAKHTLCSVYKYTGAMRVQEAVNRRLGRSFLAVLLFHRVTDEIPEDGLTVSTGRFRRICRMLRRGFRVVPLAEAVRLSRTAEPFPQRTVAVTFDDCYRDNLFAARILAEHGLPACFFVPAALVGTDHVFDWDRHLPRLPNLSWLKVGLLVFGLPLLLVGSAGGLVLLGADALLILTEWKEFINMDLVRIRQLLRSPIVLDGRNLFGRAEMAEAGLNYYSVGRPALQVSRSLLKKGHIAG